MSVVTPTAHAKSETLGRQFRCQLRRTPASPDAGPALVIGNKGVRVLPLVTYIVIVHVFSEHKGSHFLRVMPEDRANMTKGRTLWDRKYRRYMNNRAAYHLGIIPDLAGEHLNSTTICVPLRNLATQTAS